MALAGLVLVLAVVAEGQRLGPDWDADASVIGSWFLAAAVCAALPLRGRPVAVGWFTGAAPAPTTCSAQWTAPSW